MLSNILLAVTGFIIHIISTLGYGGIGFLMALQTVAIPIPSEIILPFSGYLASLGRFNLLFIALSGGLGSAVGSSIAYFIGYKGGRPLVEKYGKYIFLSESEFQLTEKFFAKYHAAAIFFGQLLPIVRSFIAFPAGITRVSYKKFITFTFLGSFIWSLVLAFVGLKLGENWTSLHAKFQKFDSLVVAVFGIGAVFWIWRHVKHKNTAEG